jgi:hypothetical protein
MKRKIDIYREFLNHLSHDFFKYGSINKKIKALEIDERLCEHFDKYFYLLDDGIEIRIVTDEPSSMAIQYVDESGENISHFTMLGYWNSNSYSTEYISKETIYYALDNKIISNNGSIFREYCWIVGLYGDNDDAIYNETRKNLWGEIATETISEKDDNIFVLDKSSFRKIATILTCSNEDVMSIYLGNTNKFSFNTDTSQYDGHIEVIYISDANFLIKLEDKIIIIRQQENDDFQYPIYEIVDTTKIDLKFIFNDEEYGVTEDEFTVMTMLYTDEHFTNIDYETKKPIFNLYELLNENLKINEEIIEEVRMPDKILNKLLSRFGVKL